MVKRSGLPLAMNVMRHLRVPNRLVEEALGHLRSNDWVSSGMRILPSEDNEYRLIPLDVGAPIELPSPLDDFEAIELEGAAEERVDSDWWAHLARMVGEDEVEKHREAWPSSHEFIGDMMVVRIDDEVAEHTSAIAEAKLRSHPHIRLALRDNGVQGEFRIRELSPIGARMGDEVLVGGIPTELCETQVLVRESGRSILCDPTRAYFSTKLQTERLETLELAKQLRQMLGRPLRICDPFCGVGPALATLLGEPGLSSDVLAADLNPHAVEMLLDNLRRWDNRPYPIEPLPLSRLHEDRMVGYADATTLSKEAAIEGKWDLLIVNLPHRTIEMMPSLIPLLDRASPSMVRGRAIVAESEIESANLAIRESLPSLLEESPEPSLRVKRDYSATLRLCSFEAWIAPTVS
jgi:tRNA G37 N-methylase Trm5|tara:strand:+ start:3794 stop:5011 length:1218 start_codon:yes stop_codon:yes gene_type:complete